MEIKPRLGLACTAWTQYYVRGDKVTMRQTRDEAGRSAAISWLIVLGLASAIFATLWGIAEICGVEDPWRFYQWQERQPWVVAAAVVALLFAVLLGGGVAQRRSRDPQRAERQALTLGTWVIYLPGFISGLPAVVGIVEGMLTPFLGGGVIAIAASLLEDADILPHYVGSWIAMGVVGSGGYESETRFLIAQALVAVGLAITIVGFIQVYRAYREKRLETRGLYATVRHPQHLGIALWTFGLALAVSGTAGYIMWFTVLYLFMLLAISEDRQLASRSGSVYEDYRRATPFMIPFVNVGLPLPSSGVLRSTALIAYYAAGLTALILILQRIGVEHNFL